jgi:hypothetical protein
VLRVRPGDRVQVRREQDEGCALTGLRTPPGTVRAVYGTGVTASILVDLDGGLAVTYRPGELGLLSGSPAAT